MAAAGPASSGAVVAQRARGHGEFSGRVALVTGAARGIGRAAALRLHGAGAAVAGVDREAVGLEGLVAEISAGGGRAVALVCDVSCDAQVKAAVRKAVAAFGRLDCVFANAGIQRYGTALDVEESQWDEVMAANLKSAFLTVRHALPHLIGAGGGSIVLTASVQGLASERNVVHYATSKAALLGLTRALAVDHAAQGIRVNAVCPGAVDTPMLRESARAEAPEGGAGRLLAEWGGAHPIGRLCTPEEVAEVVAFLLSTRSSFVTGTAVVVDGGLMAQLGTMRPVHA